MPIKLAIDNILKYSFCRDLSGFFAAATGGNTGTVPLKEFFNSCQLTFHIDPLNYNAHVARIIIIEELNNDPAVLLIG